MNLAERAEATQRTLDQYRDKPFDWAGANCIRLARAQGVEMGHSLPPIPLFRSPLGAKKALKKQGADSVEQLLDKYFPRHIAPAHMVMGDICTVEGHGGLDAVLIVDGFGNLFGWHEETDFQRLETIKFAEADIKGAWRL